jgi:hypothetical protein
MGGSALVAGFLITEGHAELPSASRMLRGSCRIQGEESRRQIHPSRELPRHASRSHRIGESFRGSSRFGSGIEVSLSRSSRKEAPVLAMPELYDYVIIGSGMAGLTVGSLLARSGKSVCLLEAHEHPGGCAHSFPIGHYTFCAAVHYIFFCGEGEPVYNFLKKIGLHESVTFTRLDPEGSTGFPVLPPGSLSRSPTDRTSGPTG